MRDEKVNVPNFKKKNNSKIYNYDFDLQIKLNSTDNFCHNKIGMPFLTGFIALV